MASPEFWSAPHESPKDSSDRQFAFWRASRAPTAHRHLASGCNFRTPAHARRTATCEWTFVPRHPVLESRGFLQHGVAAHFAGWHFPTIAEGRIGGRKLGLKPDCGPAARRPEQRRSKPTGDRPANHGSRAATAATWPAKGIAFPKAHQH